MFTEVKAALEDLNNLSNFVHSFECFNLNILHDAVYAAVLIEIRDGYFHEPLESALGVSLVGEGKDFTSYFC